MKVTNVYSAHADSPFYLDRRVEEEGCGGEDWLNRQMQAARITVVWRLRHLIVCHAGPEPVFLDFAQAQPMLKQEEGVAVYLGTDMEGTPYFAIDISSVAQPDNLPSLVPFFGAGAQFMDLRQVGVSMEPGQGAMLAYARGIAYWHMRHRFCANCGTRTRILDAGRRRVCDSCSNEHFPRNDPAIIVLITHGDDVLLARNHNFPVPGMYSTLAGFVEAGESLEDAVIREVREEVGVALTDLVYHSSQPWPFPCSLMAGFRARARGRDFCVNRDELAEAGWFSRAFLEGNPQSDSFRLPRADSIARRMIADWLEGRL